MSIVNYNFILFVVFHCNVNVTTSVWHGTIDFVVRRVVPHNLLYMIMWRTWCDVNCGVGNGYGI